MVRLGVGKRCEARASGRCEEKVLGQGKELAG